MGKELASKFLLVSGKIILCMIIVYKVLDFVVNELDCISHFVKGNLRVKVGPL